MNDQNSNPVAGAIVFVYDLPGQAFAPPADPYVMDQVNLRFVPHLLAIPVGSKVRFPNKDNILHHLYSFSPAKTFDLPLYKGEPAQPIAFPRAGAVKLGCNIHDWMSGIILVLPTPYFAETDSSGRAVLKIATEKDATVAVFHERMKLSVDETRVALHASSHSPLAWEIPLRPAPPERGPRLGYR